MTRAGPALPAPGAGDGITGRGRDSDRDSRRDRDRDSNRDRTTRYAESVRSIPVFAWQFRYSKNCSSAAATETS